MTSIMRLSLTMFSLFSISYLVTSVSAQGDPCMEAPAGPDRAACYAAQGNHSNAGGNHPQGDPCMEAPAGPDRAACYAAQGNHSNAGGNHPQGNPNQHMNQGKPNPGMGNCPSGTKKDFNSDACIKVKKGCPSGTKKDFNSDACVKE
jgi:hypothetical protein